MQRVDGSVAAAIFEADEPATWATFTHDNQHLLVMDRSDRQTILRLHMGASGLSLVRVPGVEAEVEVDDISPGGLFMLTSGGETNLWANHGRGRLEDPLFIPGSSAGATVSATFGPKGRTFAFILVSSREEDYNGTVQVWRLPSAGKPLHVPSTDRAEAHFNDTGDRVLVTDGETIARLWALDATPSGPTTLSPIALPDIPSGGYGTLTPDFRQAELVDGGRRRVITLPPVEGTGASVASGTYKLADKTLDEFQDWLGFALSPKATFLSPDGRFIATLGLNERLTLLTGHGTTPKSTSLVLRDSAETVTTLDTVFFSPDSKHLLVTTQGGLIYIVRTDGEGDPLVLRGHTGTITHAEYSPDGRHILTSSDDGSVRLWTLDPDYLLARLHEVAPFCVPAQERVQVIGEAPAEACAAFTACEQRYGRSGACDPQALDP